MSWIFMGKPIFLLNNCKNMKTGYSKQKKYSQSKFTIMHSNNCIKSPWHSNKTENGENDGARKANSVPLFGVILPYNWQLFSN